MRACGEPDASSCVRRATGLRVAHHPCDHPYVRAVGAETVAIGDVDVFDLAALDAARIDVVHLHFGLEALAPAQLAAWAIAIRQRGIGLVHTVHDLENPHLVEQRPHEERISVLVAFADVLLTLTPTAADATWARYGRRPRVVPHPHVVPVEALGSGTHEIEPSAPMLWLGTIRSNCSATVIDRWLTDALDPWDVVVRSDGWFDRSSSSGRDRVRSSVLAAVRSGHRLRLVDRPTDDALAAIVRNRPFVALPYGWGTHSGFVELCADLGVAAVVPAIGAYADQGAIATPAEASVHPRRPIEEHIARRLGELDDIRRLHALAHAEAAGWRP